MFKSAIAHSEDVIFYFDRLGNKYVAQGGSLAWRLNNPGLIRSHSHFASVNTLLNYSHIRKGKKFASSHLEGDLLFPLEKVIQIPITSLVPKISSVFAVHRIFGHWPCSGMLPLRRVWHTNKCLKNGHEKIVCFI
jgi:hypothetical protein